MGDRNPYDARYASEAYYWGKKPSAMCDRIIGMMPPSLEGRPRLLDLGCGEGRNAVYFAQNGFEVVGLDLSRPGLQKTERYAREMGVQVKTILANIVDYALDDVYEVIFSTGALHYLPPEVRAERYQDYKAHTAPKGIHGLSVFVSKPFIPRAPMPRRRPIRTDRAN